MGLMGLSWLSSLATCNQQTFYFGRDMQPLAEGGAFWSIDT